MKVVDMNTVELVHSGDVWPHEMPPCCKKMIRFLEKNEGMVTWVQVKTRNFREFCVFSDVLSCSPSKEA